MSRHWIGTSGYSYKQWKGKFYPPDLPDREMLRYYAAHHTSVEINSTFYRFPTVAQLEKWAAQVGDDFLFTLKAPRRITHKLRLRDAASEAGDFFASARAMGDKLGVLLFQLPPFLKLDLPLLEEFLASLPSGQRIAFEFRSSSWFCASVFDCLRKFGVALCVTDSEALDVPFVATAPYVYMRLRRPSYDEPRLAAMAQRIDDFGSDVSDVFVYLKHEDEGPAYADRLRSFMGNN